MSPRKFESERMFPGADRNTLYYRELQDVVESTFAVAYAERTFGTIYSPEKIRRLNERFREIGGALVKDMNEENPPIDPEISRYISGYSERLLSLDWEDMENMKELSMGAHELYDQIELRLKQLKKGLLLPDSDPHPLQSRYVAEDGQHHYGVR